MFKLTLNLNCNFFTHTQSSLAPQYVAESMSYGSWVFVTTSSRLDIKV